jgi:hypothetical protein
MRRRSSFTVAACVAALSASMLGAATPAAAAQRPVDGAVVLGFGAAYGSAPNARIHHGIDIRCAAGGAVASPVAGSVTFSGLVPASDSTGALVGCVVVAAGAEKWSLLPLDRVGVQAGQAVSAGQPLGRVSVAGDVSGGQTHLHVGLRRSGAYVDPEPELAGPPPVPSTGGGASASGGGGAEGPAVSRPADAVAKRTVEGGRDGAAPSRPVAAPRPVAGFAGAPATDARPQGSAPVPERGREPGRLAQTGRAAIRGMSRARMGRGADVCRPRDPVGNRYLRRAWAAVDSGAFRVIRAGAVAIGAAVLVVGLVVICRRKVGLEPALAWARAGPRS